MTVASPFAKRPGMKRIRNELIVTFIVIISLQFMLLFVFINYSYTKAVVEKQAQGFISSLNTVSGLIDGVMSQAEYQLMTVVGDSGLNEIFRSFMRKPTYEGDPYTQEIIGRLYQFSFSNRFIDGGYVYLYKPKVVLPSSKDPKKVIEITDPTQYAWINVPFLPDSKVSGWTLTYCFPPRDETNKTILVYKMKITDHSTGEAIGEASIDMIVSNLRNTLMDYGVEQKGSSFFIVDKAGTVMLSNSHDDTAQNLETLYGLKYRTGSGYYEANVAGKRCLVAYVPMQQADWSIMEAMPFSTFSPGLMEQLPVAIWSIALISITTTLVALILFSRSVYRPIDQLSRSMNRVVDGDLSVRIDMGRKDEFSILVRGFNEMVERINRLIGELYTQKLLTKDAEIHNLRAQLNPHFLYNTLDTLHWMAKLGENGKAAELTMALSRFYQLSLNKGGDTTTVRDAVEMAWQYLNIQKIRLGDRLDANIRADDSLMDRRMPHYLLQPLLENAVLHGVSKKQSGGSISVDFADTGSGMRISVKDDGQGIGKAQLEEIRSALAEEDPPGEGAYFALRNIRRQLNLLYGDGDWLSIESDAGSGTTVVITIPERRDSPAGEGLRDA